MVFKVLYPPLLHQHWHHPLYVISNRIYSSWHRIQDHHLIKLVLYRRQRNPLTTLQAIMTTAIPIIQTHQIRNIHGTTVTMITLLHWQLTIVSCFFIIFLFVEEVDSEVEIDTSFCHVYRLFDDMFLIPRVVALELGLSDVIFFLFFEGIYWDIYI